MRLQIRVVCHDGCVKGVAATGGLIGILQRTARLSGCGVYRLSAGKAGSLDAAKISSESVTRKSKAGGW